MDLRLIDAEIQKRRDEISALEQARAVLGGSVKSAPRRPSAARTRAQRRSYAEPGARKQQVLAALTDEPQGPTAIARAIGAGPTQVSAILKDLKGEKLTRKRKDGWVLATPSQVQDGQAQQ